MKRWIGGLLLLSLLFHFSNLKHKVYGQGEVNTSLRAAGFTQREVEATLFQNQVMAAPALLQFQQLKPGSTPFDTLQSLAVEEPQNPPLYFLLARGWMQLWGSSLVSARSFPVIISLVGLPVLYGLAMALLGSPGIAQFATLLLALSPFHLLLAQTNQPYSLLTLAVLASHWLLWQMYRSPRWPQGLAYSLGLTLGLYTHPLFGLTIVSHGVWLGWLARPGSPQHPTRSFWQAYLPSLLGALLLSWPWLTVQFNQPFLIRNSLGAVGDLLAAIQLVCFSFTALFFDLDRGFEHPALLLIKLPLLVLMAIALFQAARRLPQPIGAFILISVLVPLLLLALRVPFMEVTRSTVSQALLPCYPTIQMAVACLLWQWLQLRPKTRCQQELRRGVFGFLLATSLISCTASMLAFTWWDKGQSYFNEAVAREINTHPPVTLISDRGRHQNNTSDLISLSYRLYTDVTVLLMGDRPNLALIPTGQTTMVWRPTDTLKQALEQRWGPLELRSQAGQLWQLPEPKRSTSDTIRNTA